MRETVGELSGLTQRQTRHRRVVIRSAQAE